MKLQQCVATAAILLLAAAGTVHAQSSGKKERAGKNAAPGQAKQESVPADAIQAPKVQVGDRWMYRTSPSEADGAYTYATEVTQVDADGVNTRWDVIEGGGKVKAGSSGTIMYDAQLNAVEEVPPIGGKYRRTHNVYNGPAYSFPLYPGKTWLAADTTTYGRTVTWQMIRAKVVGWESVTVPAGTFNALKVVRNISTRAYHVVSKKERIENSVRTIWYSPEVKRTIKTEDESEGAQGAQRRVTELTEFALKDGARDGN